MSLVANNVIYLSPDRSVKFVVVRDGSTPSEPQVNLVVNDTTIASWTDTGRGDSINLDTGNSFTIADTTTVLSETGLTIGGAVLTEAELELLDGITAGSGLPSKVMTIGAGNTFTMPGGGLVRFSTDPLAAAGSTQADAAAVTDQYNVVTGADGVKGVALGTAVDCSHITIFNDSKNYALKVWTFNTGDDVINDLLTDEFYTLRPGEEALFIATSAAQWYTAKRSSEAHRATDFEVFDDFNTDTFNEHGQWTTFAGSAATAAAISLIPEGAFTCINGATPGVNDGVVLSRTLAAQGALVSAGPIVVEYRIAQSAITGHLCGFGLATEICVDANEHGMFTHITATVADGGLAIVDGVAIGMDSDATANDTWFGMNVIGSAVNATGTNLTDTAAVNTYQVLRIEVDATGDARFYIDGVLRGTQALAVATTAVLIPFMYLDESGGTPAANTLTVDYIYFSGTRPASNA